MDKANIMVIRTLYVCIMYACVYLIEVMGNANYRPICLLYVLFLYNFLKF